MKHKKVKKTRKAHIDELDYYLATKY